MDMLKFKEILKEKSIFDIPLRAVYYARVSTDKEEQLNSLDNQIFYYEDFIKKNKNWIYSGRYIDEGISGTSTKNRNDFLKMITDAKNGLFDLIITKEISRFSRSTLDSIKYTQELLSYGVGVYFQSDNINTLLPDSELRLTIMASIAQEEVRKLSERLRFGYKRSIEKGRVLGQDNTLGYDKSGCILTINEEQAKIVRLIFELYADGKYGSRRIAKELTKMGIVSPFSGKAYAHTAIATIIQNPKYKGYYCSGKTASVDYRNSKRIRLPKEQWNVYKDENIPAIVSEELWNRANEILRSKSNRMAKGEATQNRYPFSGKLVCGVHGCNYNRHIYKSKKNGEQEVWNCRLYRLKGKKEGCDSPTIYTSELNKILNDVYQNLYADKDKVINGLLEIYSNIETSDHTKDIEKVENEINIIETKKDKLLQFNIDGHISDQEFIARNNQFNIELDLLNAKLKNYKAEVTIISENKKNLGKLRKILEKEFSNTENFCSELSDTFLDKIVVNKLSGNKNHLTLDIFLKIGSSYVAEVVNNHCISVEEIGISHTKMPYKFTRCKDAQKGNYDCFMNVDIKLKLG